MKKICIVFLTLLGLVIASCDNVQPDLPQHSHSYGEDGMCECGIFDPNHNHQYVDGKCACGEVEPKAKEEIALENALALINVPTSTTQNVTLLRKHNEGDCTVYITWLSDNYSAINNYGYIKRKNYEQTAVLTAYLECGKYSKEVEYPITIPAYSDDYRVQAELDLITVDTVLTSNTTLPEVCNDSDILIEWNYSHPEIFDNNGNYNFPELVTEMTLTVTLKLNNIEKTKEFTMIAYREKTIEKNNTQNIIDHNTDFEDGVLVGLIKNEEDKLVLKDGENFGVYISPIVETSQFDTLVGSWSAITNQQTGALEVYFRVLVDGVWSDYFTYGQWRLGDKNKGSSTKSSNGVAEMDEDTIFIEDGKTASAYQYKVEFTRLESELNSPELLLVATCIKVIDYEEVALDYTKISQHVEYDVPMLNQNVVPNIGNSICSPTSTTMLLKYYGHSFVHEDHTYEHEYVAYLARDYGHNMFGNWVYNVAVMGAYGEFAYVKRFINNDELMWHLENVGPVALSVKGNMQGYYNTAGHLLVCKGYKIVDGEVIFICNDPNIKNVEVEYTYETIENVWREIAYVIEPSNKE